MKFVFIVAASVVAVAFSDGELLGIASCENVLFERKITGQVCLPRTNDLS